MSTMTIPAVAAGGSNADRAFQKRARHEALLGLQGLLWDHSIAPLMPRLATVVGVSEIPGLVYALIHYDGDDQFTGARPPVSLAVDVHLLGANDPIPPHAQAYMRPLPGPGARIRGPLLDTEKRFILEHYGLVGPGFIIQSTNHLSVGEMANDIATAREKVDRIVDQASKKPGPEKPTKGTKPTPPTTSAGLDSLPAPDASGRRTMPNGCVIRSVPPIPGAEALDRSPLEVASDRTIALAVRDGVVEHMKGGEIHAIRHSGESIGVDFRLAGDQNPQLSIQFGVDEEEGGELKVFGALYGLAPSGTMEVLLSNFGGDSIEPAIAAVLRCLAKIGEMPAGKRKKVAERWPAIVKGVQGVE